MFPRTAAALAAPAVIAQVETKEEPTAPAAALALPTAAQTGTPPVPAGAGAASHPAPLSAFVFDRAEVMAALEQALTAR